MAKKKAKYKDKYALQRQIGQAHLLPNMSDEKLKQIFIDNPDYEPSQIIKSKDNDEKIIRTKVNTVIDKRVWKQIQKKVQND